MNVAVTRAKRCLIIICNIKTVSNDSTWESLIKYARNYDYIITTKTSEIVDAAEKKWMDSTSRLDALLINETQEFECNPWIVHFSNEFKFGLDRYDSQTRQRVIRVILDISKGLWPKFELICPFVTKVYQEVIHVYSVLNLKLIWSVDVLHSECRQYVMVWNVVTAGDFPTAIRRVECGYLRYSAEYLDRCAHRKQPLQGHILPMTWNTDAPITWYTSTASQKYSGNSDVTDPEPVTQVSLQMERRHVAESAVLMKLYKLDSNVAKLLITIDNNDDVQLPFAMNAQEEEIVLCQKSVIVLGRSGTGKTTAILHRMFFENKKLLSVAISPLKERTDIKVSKQLMVTASPILCDAIRRSYHKMCDTYSTSTSISVSGDTEALELRPAIFYSPDIDQNTTGLPASLQNCKDVHFPLIITYNIFLKLLDALLPVSFLQSRR